MVCWHWRSTRRQFLKACGLGTGALLGAPYLALAAGTATPAQVRGLRERVRHIIVIYQENRSFDHYFGAYRSPHGARVDNLLDAEGRVDAHFTGQQRNPAGIPYRTLPVPDSIPGFQGALLPNRPFALAPYLPADHNVPWDPAHRFFRMYAQVHGGRMDRFVALALAGKHPASARDAGLPDPWFADARPSGAVLGFYTRDDIPDYHRLADEYVLCDHFFQAMSGGSTGNALYLVAGRSCRWPAAPAALRGGLHPFAVDHPYDRHGMLINDLPPLLGPTEANPAALRASPPPAAQHFANIGDRLRAAGVSWAWYNEGWNGVKAWALKAASGPGDGSAVIDSGYLYVPHHNPFQYFPRWFEYVRGGHMRDGEDFFTDLQAGRLPAVCFLKASGAHDEHPAESAPQWGMRWVLERLRALGRSPLWKDTLVLLTYDEGGGFWDHLPPPRPDAYGCGTRIPALLIGPYARRGYVDHRTADTTSVLKLIETRFGLPPLHTRDKQAYPLLDGLDFTQKPRDFVLS